MSVGEALDVSGDLYTFHQLNKHEIQHNNRLYVGHHSSTKYKIIKTTV